MPFRERLRKTFSRGSTDGLSQTSSNGSARKNSNVYQPGEKMPPLKYRRPVAKEHKEHLEAFDFGKAWRRRSHNSIYSPMGSRMPSRAPSVTSAPSRSASVVALGSTGLHPASAAHGPSHRRTSIELGPTGEAAEEEEEEESTPRNGERDEPSPSTSPASSAASNMTLDAAERLERWSFAD